LWYTIYQQLHGTKKTFTNFKDIIWQARESATGEKEQERKKLLTKYISSRKT